LITIAAVAGIAQPAFTGGWSAQVRRIVPDMPPARVYAVDVGTYNAGEIAGPALVGVAFIYDSAVPGAASLQAVLLLYVVVVVIMPFLPIPRRSDTHDAPAERLGPTLRHLRVMWHSVSLRRSTILGTVSFTAIAFLVVAAPVIGTDLAGDAGFGAFLLTSIATGALIGTLLLAKRPLRVRGPGTIAFGSTVVLAVLLLGLSLSPTIAIAYGIGFLFGAMQAPQLTAIFQVRDRESPTKVRSLVFVASASLRTGSFAVGSLAAGALLVFGWRWVIVGAAILELLALVIGLIFAPKHRRMPRGE
jgi:MFS family permease